MEIQGCQLEFISMILRDGSGTKPVDDDYKKVLNKQIFDVRRLSISENTYIASDFNSFVVRLKPPQIGHRIATLTDSPHIQNGKMIFCGSWKHINIDGMRYELIGRSWQCELCGSVSEMEGEQCDCLTLKHSQ